MHPPDGTSGTDTNHDRDRFRPHRLPDPLGAIFGVIVPRAVDSIDLNDLLDHIDVDRLISRVDIDALIDRVDVDNLVGRVDIARVLQSVDIADIVARAQIEAMVAEQATAMSKRAVDLIRRQLVGIDVIVSRVVDRTLRRDVVAVDTEDSLTGAFGGPASRLVAFLVDMLLVSAMFTGLTALVLFMASLFIGHHLQTSDKGVWYLIGFGVFALLYQWVGLVIFGRTAGMGLCGLVVLAPDRTALGPVAATRRVLVYPFSFVLGLGLIGIVLGRRHRALHDVAAPSVVCCEWGGRSVELPAPISRFFARRAAGPPKPEGRSGRA